MLGKKKIKIIMISAACVVVAAGAVTAGIVIRNANTTPINVYPVSDLGQSYWGDSSTVSGMVTSDVTQQVYVESNRTVSDILVQQGQAVNEGDELFTYDTTLDSLNLESEKLNKQSLELQKTSLEKDIENLKNGTYTYSGSVYGTSGTTGMTPTAAVSSNITAIPMTSRNTSFSVVNLSVDNPSADNSGADTQSEDGDTTQGSANSIVENVPTEVENAVVSAELNFDSVPNSGDGTKESPYRFWVSDTTIVKGSFFNKVAGYKDAAGTTPGDQGSAWFMLYCRTDDSAAGALSKYTKVIAGNCQGGASDEGWSIKVTEDIFTYSWVTVDPLDNPGNTSDDNGDEIEDGSIVDDGADGGIDGGSYTMTEEEKKAAITEKENSLKSLELDMRQSDITIQELEGKVNNATVTSTITGVVETVGDTSSDAFITISNTGGLYIKGSISELALGDITVGQTITGTTYQSGMSFSATIKEISDYPDTSDSAYGNGNPNASYYPFMAKIEDGTGLINNEYADVSIETQTETSANSIYIQNAFVRTDGGENYVYVDENGKLKKHVVTTGKTIWGSYIEILDGISQEDLIAFPYGKGVSEGAKTKEATTDMLYQ